MYYTVLQWRTTTTTDASCKFHSQFPENKLSGNRAKYRCVLYYYYYPPLLPPFSQFIYCDTTETVWLTWLATHKSLEKPLSLSLSLSLSREQSLYSARLVTHTLTSSLFIDTLFTTLLELLLSIIIAYKERERESCSIVFSCVSVQFWIVNVQRWQYIWVVSES